MNDINNLTLPPTKIPNHITLVLHLLRTEIKHHTLTNAFDKLGMDTSMYSTNLGGVVLALCGCEETSDKIFEWYYKKLDDVAEENHKGENDLNEIAFNFYTEIVMYLKGPEGKA